jgi:hypothetical protein
LINITKNMEEEFKFNKLTILLGTVKHSEDPTFLTFNNILKY